MLGLKSRQIFFLLVLAAAIYAGSQLIPVQVRAYQFSDFVYSEVKFAASNRRTTEKLMDSIMQEARIDGIPITARDIHITRRGPAFTVDIDYILPVDLRVYQIERKFHVNASGENFE